MDAFRNKGTNEIRTFTAAFNKFTAQGATISQTGGSYSVSVALHEDSEVDDPNPSAMLNGSPSFNSTDVVTLDLVKVPANTGLMQSITGGVVGALYVVTFQVTLSTGEKPYEQATLFITEYVPDP